MGNTCTRGAWIPLVACEALYSQCVSKLCKCVVDKSFAAERQPFLLTWARKCAEAVDLGREPYAREPAEELLYAFKTFPEVVLPFRSSLETQEEPIWNVLAQCFSLRLSSDTVSKVSLCILFTIKHLKHFQLRRVLWLTAHQRQRCILPSQWWGFVFTAAF